MTATIDRRILAPGLRVTVADLVAVFVDHYRPDDAMTACTACRHRYSAAEPMCPSMALAVPLLGRRRHEDPSAMPEWVRQALKEIKVQAPRRPAPAPVADAELFDAAGCRVARAPRQRKPRKALP